MNNPPTVYEVMVSIAARKREMASIHIIVKELLSKVKKLNQRHDELRSLNFLDDILLKELNTKNGSN